MKLTPPGNPPARSLPRAPAQGAPPFCKGGLRGIFPALALIATCLYAPASASSGTELRVQAAFLFNFAKFVSWPEKKFAAPGSPIDLCVLEDDPITPVLEETVHGKLIGLRTLVVRRSKTSADWSRCHIAFINIEDAARVAAVFENLSGHSVLTVHQSGRSLHGGVIRFYVEDRKMRFEINAAAAEREAVQLSAKLMSVAAVVRE